MNVLIIGATGYLGTSIDRALQARGYSVSGIARSDTARHRLEARGTKAVPGDVSRPQTLDKPARQADAVIYCANVTDADPHKTDLGALRSIARALAGSEKTFVYTSHTWVYGDTYGAAHEDSPLAPPAREASRPGLEHMTLNMTKIGVRGFVVRPGLAYGAGNAAASIPVMFKESARERGAASIVGDGNNHWATIHVDDLGEFYVALLERGRPGRAYNAVNDTRFTVREIAEAASRGAGRGGATTLVHPEILGPFGDCLVLDQRIQAERAKNDLGWKPRLHNVIAELEGTHLIAS